MSQVEPQEVPAPIPAVTVRVKRPWYAPWRQVQVIESNVVDMRHKDNSLIASAQRLLGTKLTGSTRRAESWMDDAWTMFDLLGELHFLATTLAQRGAKARFYVGRVEGSDVIEITDPSEGEVGEERVDPNRAAGDRKARSVFSSLGDGFIGLQEIVERAFVNQFIVGACYLVGAPKEVWNPVKGVALRRISEVPVEQLVWRTLSLKELVPQDGFFEYRQSGSQASQTSTRLPKESVYVVALWNGHPADNSVPDSPVRASLPVLRELVGLTQHVSAQIDSRLAGAGLLIMYSSASRAIKRALGLDDTDPRDPFTELLVQGMVTPIADRDSASAVVPLVVTIPDESKKPDYISFATPLDQHSVALREEAIRRIALGLDAPPELLLGQGTTSHWTAWLTQEEVVDSHIAPTLALIARGLTMEFLRPILRANGLSESAAQQYAIWFDVSELTVKANQAADAKELHTMGLLSDDAVRRANGFNEADAPKKQDVKEQAIDLVRDMVVANPGLMNRPGLDVLVEQMVALLEGRPQSGIAASKAALESSGSTSIAQSPTAGGAPTPPEGGGSPTVPGAAPGGTRPTTPPSGVRSPSTAITTPGLPQTRAAASGGTEAFGTWDE